jgi:hypothetical protein
LLVQIALLIAVGRGLGELMQRIGQPSVIGELATARKKFNAVDIAVEELFARIRRVTVSTNRIHILLTDTNSAKRPIEIPWEPQPKGQTQIRLAASASETKPTRN